MGGGVAWCCVAGDRSERYAKPGVGTVQAGWRNPVLRRAAPDFPPLRPGCGTLPESLQLSAADPKGVLRLATPSHRPTLAAFRGELRKDLRDRKAFCPAGRGTAVTL